MLYNPAQVLQKEKKSFTVAVKNLLKLGCANAVLGSGVSLDLSPDLRAIIMYRNNLQ